MPRRGDPDRFDYSIDYATCRRLESHARTRSELAALERLVLFEGTAADLRIAAAIMRRTGDQATARELLATL